MSKLFSKVSPSFPEATNPLPSHNYEGDTLKLVIQEAMKQEPAVATFHNNTSKTYKNNTYVYFCIQSISVNITINNRDVEAFLLGNTNIEFCRQCWKSADPNPSFSGRPNPSLTFGAS